MIQLFCFPVAKRSLDHIGLIPLSNRYRYEETVRSSLQSPVITRLLFQRRPWNDAWLFYSFFSSTPLCSAGSEWRRMAQTDKGETLFRCLHHRSEYARAQSPVSQQPGRGRKKTKSIGLSNWNPVTNNQHSIVAAFLFPPVADGTGSIAELPNSPQEKIEVTKTEKINDFQPSMGMKEHKSRDEFVDYHRH